MPICKIGDKLILFVHVPRTAGTTVEHHLSKFGKFFFKSDSDAELLRVSAQHLHGADLEAIFPKGTFDYTFMFVRNPIDRLVSVYNYQNSVRPMKQAVPFGIWLRHALLHRKWKPYYRDNHLRPQVEFECFGGEVFRLEDGVGKAFDRLHELFGVEKPERMENFNRSAGPLPEITRADIKLIHRVYFDDFERYGYPRAQSVVLEDNPQGI
jgi:hypothetical protein